MIRHRRFRCAAAAVVAGVVALAASLVVPAAARAADDSPTLKRIKQKGMITFAYREDARPFSSRGPDGLPVGYSIDLCKQVADEVRRETGLKKLRVDWIPVDAKSRFTVTGHGLADMVCGTTSMTLARMKLVDFSLVTFVTGSSLLVPNTMVPDLRRIGTATIGVLAGTTSEKGLKAYVARNNLPIAVQHVRNQEQALRQIDRGEIQGYVSDFILLKDIQDRLGERGKYRVGGEFLSYDPYGLIVPRNNSGFRAVVNRRLVRLFRGNGFRTLQARWFKGMESSMPPLMVYAVAVQSIPE